MSTGIGLVWGFATAPLCEVATLLPEASDFLGPAVRVGLVNFVVVRGTHVNPELGEKRVEGRKGGSE
jgi:hypothetical protein